MDRETIFLYYEDYLNYSPNLRAFTIFYLMFTWLQVYIIQFLPIIKTVNYLTPITEELYELFINFGLGGDADFSVKVIIIYYLLFSTFLINCIFYLLFLLRVTTGPYLRFVQSFFLQFPVIIFSFPLSAHFGRCIREYSKDTDNRKYLTLIIVDSCMIFISYLVFKFSSPVGTNSPSCTHSFVPSRLIPDRFFHDMFFQLFFANVILNITDQFIALVGFSIIQIIYSIYIVIYLNTCGFYMEFPTISMIASCFAFIVLQIIIIFIMASGIETNLYIFYVSIGVLLISGYIVNYIKRREYDRIYIHMKNNDFEYLKKIDTQKLYSICYRKNITEKSMFDFMKNHSKGILKLLISASNKKFQLSKVAIFYETLPIYSAFSIYRLCKFSSNLYDDIEKFNSEQFWTQMMKGDVNRVMKTLIDQSRYATFNLEKMSDEPIKLNMVKLLNNYTHKKNSLYFLVSIISFIAFLILFIYPIVNLKDGMELISDIPKLLRHSIKICNIWSTLIIGIENGVNCTKYLLLNFSQLESLLHVETGEPLYSNKFTVASLNLRYEVIARDLGSNIIEFVKLMRTFKNPGIEYIAKQWLTPSIPIAIAPDHSKMLTDIRGLILFYCSTIISLAHNDPNETSCANRLYTYFRNDIVDVVSISSGMQEMFVKLIDMYYKYIDNAKGMVSVKYRYFIFGAVFFTIFIITFIIWDIYKIKDVGILLVNHFRVSVHPMAIEDDEFSDTVNKITLADEVQQILYFIGILTLIFLSITIGLNYHTYEHFRNLVHLNKINIALENISILTAMCVHSYFEIYMFNDKMPRIAKFYSDLKDFGKMNSLFNQLFSLNETLLFRHTDKLPLVMRKNTTADNRTTIHDFYSRFSLSDQVDYLDFLFSDIDRIIPVDINDILFLHVIHISINHIYSGIIEVQKYVESLSDSIFFYLLSLMQINIIILLIYALVIISYMYYQHDLYRRMRKILHLHIMKLPIEYIGSQKCLMEYLIENRANNNKIITTIKELFDATGVPVLFTLENIIVCFTTKVPLIFNFRDDEILGQNVNLLFPIGNARFYNILRSNQVGRSIIQGKTSDGDIFNIEVNVNNFEPFKMLSLKNIDDLMTMEELIQIHSDLKDELFKSEYPLEAFRTKTVRDFVSGTFRSHVFLIIYSESILKPNISAVSEIINYFDKAFVIYQSCSMMMLIFIDDMQFLSAIKCYNQVKSLRNKSGAIIEGEHIDIALYNIPFGPDNSMEEEILDSTPPYLSIEPKFNMMNYLAYISRMKSGYLICSHSITKYVHPSILEKVESNIYYINNSNVPQV